MRIFIVNPPFSDDFCRSSRVPSRLTPPAHRPPENLLTAVAILEQAGHRVEFLDGAALNMPEEKVLSAIADFFPDLVVFHSTTPSIYNDIYYSKLSKKIGVPLTALIGAHVTAEPEDTFKIAEGGVDVIVRGEYEFILRELASTQNLQSVAGISYQIEGKLFHNPPAPLPDLNEFPFPAWEKIKPEQYRNPIVNSPFLTIVTARGCDFKCTFCNDIQVMSGDSLRFKSPKKVVDEMFHCLELFPQIREFLFETETFTADKNHVEGICREIIKRNLKVSWGCNARVDMNLDLMGIMRLAGCRFLSVGYEFGTQRSLDAVKKGATLEQARDFTQKAKNLGFKIHGHFLIGAPEETIESAKATVRFAKSLKIDTASFSPIAAYPGTEIYKWAKENNALMPNHWNEWVNENYEQAAQLNLPELGWKEIDEAVRSGLNEFPRLPNKVAMIANRVKNIGNAKKAGNLKNIVGYLAGKKQE